MIATRLQVRSTPQSHLTDACASISENWGAPQTQKKEANAARPVPPFTVRMPASLRMTSFGDVHALSHANHMPPPTQCTQCIQCTRTHTQSCYAGSSSAHY